MIHPSCVPALAEAAGRPEWVSLQDIDMPLHQCSLSQSIDLSSFNVFLSSALSPRFWALAHSSSLPHAGDWLNAIPSSSLGLHLMDQEFRVCLQYAKSVLPLLILWVTIRWAAVGMVTEYCATTQSVTPSSILLSLQL